MAESFGYLIFQNREKEFCDLIEELWTYRLMPDFGFQVEQLKRGDVYDRRVGTILSDKAKTTRINCPCCNQVTSSRFVEQLESEGEPSTLCYLCEMCGNVIRMRPLAVESSSTSATSHEATSAGLQIRSPKKPEPDLMEELLSQLSVRGQNLLDIEGLTTIEQLCQITVGEFCELRIPNSKLYEEFREKLACFGRSLVGDEEFLRDYVTHHFLNAIYDSPEVDEPRLAYAAWLEKNEIPLGEFIRTQVELAKLDESDPRFNQLQQRESELLAYYRWQWLDQKGLATGFGTANFCRGFVETAEVDPFRDDIDGVGRLLQRHPLIWKLRFACNSSRLHEQIDFEYDPKDYYGDILCQPWMSQIEVFSLWRNRVDDIAAITIARSQHAVNLRRLDLSYNNIGDAGAEALTDSTYLAGLEELDLRENPIGEAAAERLRQRFGDRVQLQYGRHSVEA